MSRIATAFAGESRAFEHFLSILEREPTDGPNALGNLPVEFARFIARLAGRAATVDLLVAACLASHRVGESHTCADLPAFLSGEIRSSVDEILRRCLPEAFSAGEWCGSLLGFSSIVSPPPETGVAVRTPLVLDGAGRLYLGRYWTYEREVAEDLLARARRTIPVDETKLAAALVEFFPDDERERSAPNWQRVAGAVAATRGLCVLSGGPGTGKTWTVVRLLATLARLRLAEGGPSLEIRLAAPTGKAAARMKQAIEEARRTLPDDLQPLVPQEATTIQRLLGARSGSIYFRHGAERKLPLDVLVVDEASMVDLPLMAKMLRALGEDARLVLVGDKDQLASVEAGSVLGDVCSWSPGFREAARARMAKLCDDPIPALPDTGYDGLVRDCVVVLTRNRRFGPESGIHRLAQAVRASSVDGVMEAFAKPEQVRAEDGGPGPDVAFVDVTSSRQLLQLLRETAPAGYRDYLGIARKGRSEGLFDSFNRFRFLCAVRQGDFGVEHVNAAIADVLDGANLISGPGEWYAGRPIMVTRNDYSLNLFNGVVGIAVGDQRTMRVHFEGDTSLPPARLPTHETVYAMTIHKSQGSEFGTVVVVLPPEDSRILGRELLYTAITRAKSRVVLWGSKKSLEAAIATTLARSSGLADALWTRTSPA